MKILSYLFLCIILLLLTVHTACLSSGTQHSKKVFLTGVNILYGPVSETDLFAEYPAWQEGYDAYEINVVLLDSLTRWPAERIKVEIFLGTWCGDSRREVPRFLKIIDKSGFVSKDSLYIWAVDRNKELDNGLTIEKDISRVATFLIFFNGQEIGRIVERPQTELLERDIFKILKRIPVKSG